MTINHPRRWPIALIALIVLPLLGLAEPASAATQRVTVTAPDPYVGADLMLSVTASASDNSLIVFRGTTAITDAIAMNDTGPTTVRIPTGAFAVNTSYTLRVEVSNGDIGGSATVSFTPRPIPAMIRLASHTVSYGSPVYGELVPTVPTSVVPTGAMILMRAGEQTASRTIRTDRTFGVVDLGLTPGAYPGTSMGYRGDANFAVNDVDTPLTVTVATTSITGSLNTYDLQMGATLTAYGAVVRPPDDESAWDSVVEVTARRAGSADGYVAIGSAPAARQTPVDLTAWANQNPGTWFIRITYRGSDTHAMSYVALASSLTVRQPGVLMRTSTTTLDLSRPTSPQSGDPVTATAKVTTDAGAVVGAKVTFWVDNWSRAVVTTDVNGIAQLSLPTTGGGAHTIIASTASSARYTHSESTQRNFTERRAATVSAPGTHTITDGEDLVLPISVATSSGATDVGGSAEVLLNGQRVALQTVSGGSATATISGLGVGIHTLEVLYQGDDRTLPTSASVVVAVEKADDPEPPAKVQSTTTVSLAAVTNRRATLRVAVKASARPTGRVQVMAGRRIVGTGVLPRTGRPVITVRTASLPKGKVRLTVNYLGSGSVLRSARTVVVRVR